LIILQSCVPVVNVSVTHLNDFRIIHGKLSCVQNTTLPKSNQITSLLVLSYYRSSHHHMSFVLSRSLVPHKIVQRTVIGK